MRRIAVADRRAELLDAAVRVIAAKGVAQASVRAVAAEAGMPVASVHYVFASRDAMLDELVGAVVAAQGEHIVAALTGIRDAEAFVRAALEAWLDRAIAEPHVEVALRELLTWSRWAPGREDLAARIYAAYEEAVLAVIRIARERFGTSWSVPDEDVARLGLVLTDGVAARWLVDRDEAAARAALRHGAVAVLALLQDPAR